MVGLVSPYLNPVEGYYAIPVTKLEVTGHAGDTKRLSKISYLEKSNFGLGIESFLE
jgi:hypothetical protein